MSECIFCRIAAGTIPATLVNADEQCVAFHDLQPQAPVHVLVIPRRHVAALSDTRPEDAALLGHLLASACRIARQLELTDGYRIVINSGEAAGQSVLHLHVHLLGGRRMSWPPG